MSQHCWWRNYLERGCSFACVLFLLLSELDACIWVVFLWHCLSRQCSCDLELLITTQLFKLQFGMTSTSFSCGGSSVCCFACESVWSNRVP
mmetsp:Transcript_114341/g.369746  ORF Transcript_114341/g.369746 Transcript_114341/m.369746 type:complete len:91 (+) Transcript_114341:575-847(+)